MSGSRYPWSGEAKDDEQELLKPRNLDAFSPVFRRFRSAAAPSWQRAGGAIWAGETAALQDNGGPGVSDRFESTLWLYDQLGQQGEASVSRMLRECLACGDYTMLNVSASFAPLPDFFSTVLWRQVVGAKVLRVSRVNVNETLRMYARCGRAKQTMVLVAVNLGATTRSVVLRQGDSTEVPQQKREWLLSAGTGTGMASWGHSPVAALNGKPLRLSAAGEMPALPPRVTTLEAPVVLPALSVGLVEYDAPPGSVCF